MRYKDCAELKKLLKAHGMQHTALALSSVPRSQMPAGQPCMCLIAVCGIQQSQGAQALA